MLSKKAKNILKKVPLIKASYDLFLTQYENLFFNRPIRRNAEIVRKNISCSLSNKETINVYFIFTQCQLWGLQSVYDEFSSNKKFDPVVVVMPNTEDKTENYQQTHDINLNFFNRLGVKVLSALDENSNIMPIADTVHQNSIIFYDLPFPQLPNDWMFDNASRRSLLCYVPYGFKVAKSYQAHFNLRLHNIAWKIYCETEWHRAQFSLLGERNASNVVVSGYPKFDSYRKPVKPIRREHHKKVASEYENVVIWAPHWSILDDFLGYSTFDLYYKKFQDIAQKNTDTLWVFKPHQRLRYHLYESGFMKEREVEEYYKFWADGDNTDFFGEGDYLDLFTNSSALITDSGSFLAEFLPSKKPVLLLNSLKSVGYNDFGRKIVEHYYIANKWEQIEGFFNNVVLQGKDTMGEERKKLIPLVMPSEKASSGAFIVENIESSICTLKEKI